MNKKIDILRAHMEKGEWEKAIRLASKFPRLGKEKDAIMRAAASMTSPELYRGMGKCPDALFAAGVEALKARYL